VKTGGSFPSPSKDSDMICILLFRGAAAPTDSRRVDDEGTKVSSHVSIRRPSRTVEWYSYASLLVL
jgi:N-acetyl-anhydromuramyl-L-alanine amidase AmpD